MLNPEVGLLVVLGLYGVLHAVFHPALNIFFQ